MIANKETVTNNKKTNSNIRLLNSSLSQATEIQKQKSWTFSLTSL